jgi:hypothetical protein
MFPGKSSKQVKKRWSNHLDPNLTLNKKWTQEEDQLIVALYQKLGGKWDRIKEFLPGRSADLIKSRYHCNIKRKLERAEFVHGNLC